MDGYKKNIWRQAPSTWQLLDLGLRHFLLGWSCFLIWLVLIIFEGKPPKWQDPTSNIQINIIGSNSDVWMVSRKHTNKYKQTEEISLAAVSCPCVFCWPREAIENEGGQPIFELSIFSFICSIMSKWFQISGRVSQKYSCASLLSCYFCQLTWWVEHLKK